MAAIEMKNIVKQYGDGFPAVNDVSIDVEDGEFLILVGPDPFNPPYGQLATASVVVTVPIILIVLLFQRKIVAGLTSGAVKG